MGAARRREQSLVPEDSELRLRPPGSDGGTRGDAGDRLRVLAWLVGGVLLLLAFAVIVVLPAVVDTPQSPSTSAPRPDPQLPEPSGDTDAQRQLAEQALRRLLERQAELKLAGAPNWAQDDWRANSARIAQADRLFGERRFADARQQYLDVLERLEGLRASRPERLAQALAEGDAALESDAVAPALAAYRRALAIEPDNPRAAAGLQRAQARPAVLQRMAEVADAEQADRLEAALAAARAARALDAAYTPALQAETRLAERIARRDFDAAMNRALAALERGAFGEADAALDAAAAIDADHPALSDTRARLDDARRRQRLAALRKSAAQRAGAEDWSGALAQYRKALSVDAAASFARHGVARAEARLALHEQFDHYLVDPGRLYSPEPLANAERLLANPPQIDAGEPKLQAKLAALRERVEAARQPLSVQLRSDGQTDVVIYHVGRQGRFTQKQLSLKPGTYTAVGSRPGYRDVRRVFELKPGQNAPLIDIRCREPV